MAEDIFASMRVAPWRAEELKCLSHPVAEWLCTLLRAIELRALPWDAARAKDVVEAVAQVPKPLPAHDHVNGGSGQPQPLSAKRERVRAAVEALKRLYAPSGGAGAVGGAGGATVCM